MEIKLAIDRYDRHFPFFDGSLTHSFDFDIKPFQVGQSALLQHGTDRHELFSTVSLTLLNFQCRPSSLRRHGGIQSLVFRYFQGGCSVPVRCGLNKTQI